MEEQKIEEEEDEFVMYKPYVKDQPIVNMNKKTAWMSYLEKLEFDMLCNKLP
jgi:hypothetical protein